MWESEFSNTKLWKRQPRPKHDFTTSCHPDSISKVQLLYWREHCIECAPPECYHSCNIYEPREDKRCVRVQYGIYPNSSFTGLFKFGADVRFKRWAKLGTWLYPAMFSPEKHRILQSADIAVAKIVRNIFKATNKFNPNEWLKVKYHNPQRILYKTHAYLREAFIRSLKNNPADPIHIDLFVMECYSFAEQPFRMQIEYTNKLTQYRNSVYINPGANYIEIPFDNIQKDKIPQGSIIVYPENDLDVRVVFTWLDFIQSRHNVLRKEIPAPAEKVKCIAWDLDNTLWKGILIEDGPEKLIIPDDTIQCIKALDDRGIIQTIVSKNDHDEAWKTLERYNLHDYFIYPAINWSPKSVNLQKIARKINIGIDTFALIDDSDFERAEVQSALPQVRTFTEKDIQSLLLKPEFDIPVTDESRSRRLSYLTQIQRENVQEQYGDDITSFLKDCQIKLWIFIPEEPAQRKRCLELIQRSNQLNLSTRRYSETEFESLLQNPSFLCIALRCSDRFGNYGTIGFASVNESGQIPQLNDFVISCRVAQKKIEHSFIMWLARHEKNRGCQELTAELLKTKKNGPLMRVFDDLPFIRTKETDDEISLTLNLDRPQQPDTVITVIDDTGLE